MPDIVKTLRHFSLDGAVLDTIGTFPDSEGHLRARRTRAPGEEADEAGWGIFDPDGRRLGVVELPAGLEVYEIGPDYVLGKMLDELDVERVVLLPLDRSGG